MGLLVVGALLALLTLNALTPPRNPYLGAVATFPGMLVTELCRWFMVLVVAVTGLWVALVGPSDLGAAGWTGVGFSVLAVLGCVVLLVRESRVAPAGAAAVADALGGGAPAPARGHSPWAPFKLSSPGVHLTKDLAYGDAPRKRNLLDVYAPVAGSDDGAPRPVLLQVHGGTWMYGNKEQQGKPLMNRMVEAGWVCVAVNYRLSPADAWPAHIVDVKQAIAWVRAHIATYGGDPDHIVVTGGSAGGHLSALAALTPNDPAFQPGFETADTTVAGAVPLYGVYDLAGTSDVASAVGLRDFVGRKIFRADPTADLAPFVAASPLSRVNDAAPDFFVLHGDTDTTADIEQSRALVKALRGSSRARVDWFEVPGAQHMFDTFHSPRTDAVVETVAAWLVARHAAHRTDRA